MAPGRNSSSSILEPTGPLMSGATYVHTYRCMREREGVYRGVCVCIQMYLRTHWNSDDWRYLCTYMYVYERERGRVQRCVCVYTDVFTHTHWTSDEWRYLYTYIYVHTYMCMGEREDGYRQRCVCVDSDVCTHTLSLDL